MKIGLLTYHHVVNPGSALQTVCGYKLLQYLYPCARIEIIDYYPEASQQYNASRCKTDPSYKRSQTEIQRLLRQHCRFSNFQIRYDIIAAGMASIARAGYDIIFSGSDTVLQIDGYLGQYIAGPPAPNLYYLPGKLSARKIGLAVSFDPPQPYAAEAARRLGEHVRDFEMVFYRDAHSESTLKEMGVGEDTLAFCPDPTLMVDFHGLLPPVDNDGQGGCRFIGYSVDSEPARQVIREFISEKGFRPIDLMQLSKYGGSNNYFRPAPYEYRLLAYREISGLITDRFHGSIFAMQLGEYPVVGIERDSVYPDRHGKLWDLYHRLGIESAVVRTQEGKVQRESLEKAWEFSRSKLPSTKLRLQKLRQQGFENILHGLVLLGYSSQQPQDKAPAATPSADS